MMKQPENGKIKEQPAHINYILSAGFRSSIWLGFYEESKLVYRMTYQLAFFRDCSLQTIKPGLGSIRRLGKLEAPRDGQARY